VVSQPDGTKGYRHVRSSVKQGSIVVPIRTFLARVLPRRGNSIMNARRREMLLA
jgi:hypothetical protein